MVYTRVGEGGFDGGRFVEADSCLVRQEPGIVYSYRVAAVNAGGTSFPSEILSACRVPDERGMVLVVNGFDRVSGPLCEASDLLAGFRCDLDAGVPYLRDISYIGPQRVFDRALYASADAERALGVCESGLETEVIAGNTFDYPAMHGASIARAGYSFCSASAGLWSGEKCGLPTTGLSISSWASSVLSGWGRVLRVRRSGLSRRVCSARFMRLSNKEVLCW